MENKYGIVVAIVFLKDLGWSDIKPSFILKKKTKERERELSKKEKWRVGITYGQATFVFLVSIFSTKKFICVIQESYSSILKSPLTLISFSAWLSLSRDVAAVACSLLTSLAKKALLLSSSRQRPGTDVLWHWFTCYP